MSFPDIRKKAFSLLLLSIKLSEYFVNALFRLRNFPSILSFFCVFFILKRVEFFQMLFMHLLSWSCGSFLYSINTMIELINIGILNPTLHSWDKSHLIMVFLILLYASVRLNIFISIVIRDIYLHFSFLVISLSDIRVVILTLK